MKITFLGTGTSSGVPMIACSCAVCRSEDPLDHRLRSSVMIESGGKVVVVDTGPDFRTQMLRAKVSRLDAVLFTHEHKDHIAGMDDVRAFNFAMRQPVDIYASKRVMGALENEYHYVFHDNGYPGVPRINPHFIEEYCPFEAGGLQVLPVLVWHHRLPVLAFRVGDFAYATDVNAIDDKGKEQLSACKTLVISALRKEKHLAHFNLEEALRMVDELGAEQAFLTHISHQLGKHADISRQLPGHVALAYDGLTLSV